MVLDALELIHQAVLQQSHHRAEFSIDHCLFIVNTFQSALLSKRNGHARINSISHSSISPQFHPLIHRYLQNIVQEKLQLCQMFLQLIDSHLLPLSPSVESKVVLCRSKADILRLCVDLSSNPQTRQGILQQAFQTFQMAHQLASGLHPLHSLRLEVALQYCTTLVELIPSMKHEAILIARHAWQAAVDQLEHQERLSGHEEESRALLLRLHQCFTTWSTQED